RAEVKSVIDVDASLGDLLVQTMFRRRETLLLLRSGMQLIGSRYSPDTQRLREFAAHNRLAFHWIDLDNDSVAPALLQTLGLAPPPPSWSARVRTPATPGSRGPAFPGCSQIRQTPSCPPWPTSPTSRFRAASSPCSSSAQDPPASHPPSMERPKGSRLRSSTL